MRVAIVYDCLYPWRVGGAERWYRALAEELVRRGEDVVYLTRREWSVEPSLPFAVVAVSGTFGEDIYTESGRRKIAPTLRFGFGVWRYVRRHRDIDVVHSGSFPFFSVLGARAARFGRRRPPLFVDVIEAWPLGYWRRYAGSIAGSVGWVIERLAIRLSDVRFTFTRHQQEALRAPMTVLPGLFAGAVAAGVAVRKQSPFVVFVGRLIEEKGVHVIPPTIVAARRVIPELRCVIIGDGPERGRLESEIDRLGLRDVVSLRGFVGEDELQATLAEAACVLLPSVREGYGLIVVEAAALGTPTVTLRHDQNAASTLIEPGVNGWLVDNRDPEVWGAAVSDAVRSAPTMKASALAWGRAAASSASVQRSVDVILKAYEARLRRR